jgi:hypothetical protein
MLHKNILVSCKNCIAGHRASHCEHLDRPLYAIKNKGRGGGTNGPSKLAQHPDFLRGINDPALGLFHQNMMTDPKMYKEYYHDDNVTSSSPRKRPAPYAKEQQGNVGKVDGMYGGRLSPQQVILWRQLCGLEPQAICPFPQPNTPVSQMQEISPSPTVETDVVFRDVQIPPVVLDDIPWLEDFNIAQGFCENMNLDDFTAMHTDVFGSSLDVAEAQSLHPDLLLPTAWDRMIQEAFGGSCEGEENMHHGRS